VRTLKLREVERAKAPSRALDKFLVLVLFVGTRLGTHLAALARFAHVDPDVGLPVRSTRVIRDVREGSGPLGRDRSGSVEVRSKRRRGCERLKRGSGPRRDGSVRDSVQPERALCGLPLGREESVEREDRCILPDFSVRGESASARSARVYVISSDLWYVHDGRRDRAGHDDGIGPEPKS
jgi:hypothetical protein